MSHNFIHQINQTYKRKKNISNRKQTNNAEEIWKTEGEEIGRNAEERRQTECEEIGRKEENLRRKNRRGKTSIKENKDVKRRQNKIAARSLERGKNL